jgi:hypothetical protein
VAGQVAAHKVKEWNPVTGDNDGNRVLLLPSMFH